ncbi:MAG: AraC family transcriptional regulator [Deltaproteobacteria bacterium]|nr:AraC family transcriptional regulator [Deltaproteobacteria bacterium]
MHTIGTGFFQQVLREAENAGFSRTALLLELEIGDDTVTDPEARIPHVAMTALFSRLSSATDDPCLGVELARHTQNDTGGLGVLQQLVRHSSTLHEALWCLCRYAELLDSTWICSLNKEGGRSIFRLETSAGCELHPYAVQWLFGRILLVTRELTRRWWAPLEVHVKSPRPEGAQKLADVMGAPIHFGSSENLLVLRSEDLSLSLPTANPSLSAILERYAGQLLHGIPGPGFLSQLRHVVGESLHDGAPISQSARRMHMSERTLQRRLGEHDTSYREVLAEVRQACAERFLKEGQKSINEISTLLGYSDQSAFCRAFRRWTGIAPGVFRGQILGGSALEGFESDVKNIGAAA